MKNIFAKCSLILCGVCLSFIAWTQSNTASTSFSKVQSREYEMDFTTYPFSDPDPVANFSKIYPYFRFDGFTETPIQKKWKVVEIENDFIKILILPEVGGKIWAAIDKKTNQSFVYYNHTVKFRDVALRGPWTSGGIEANYGIIGHTPNCATPVDYIITPKEDGSVSCVIGVLDLLTQTNWRLDINVPIDKAFFTTQSFWYNATPTEQPYYHWMNVGLKVSGNLEYIYPGTHYLGHEGEYSDWPINKDNGKNISFYNNNNFGGYKSYHVFGKYTHFFGGYWHDDDFGMVRFANHDDKAGKKIWIWGQSRQGMIWEKYLTDNDQQYTEVQSGRLFNQNAEKSTFTPFKHVNFMPYSTDTWKEYWYAVNQTKGIVDASKLGALNMMQENGWLKIYFCPVQAIDDVLEIKVGEKIIFSKKIKRAPTVNFIDSVAFVPKKDAYTVSLGGVKLNYNSDPMAYVLSRPLASPASMNWNSAEGLFIQGKEFMDQKLYPQAQEKLAASLRKDSNYVPALVKMSSLLYQQHQFIEALELVKRAISLDTHHGAANYYYGIINVQLKNFIDAKDGFDVASLSTEYKSGAFTELAKIYIYEKDFTRAIEYAQKALTYNAFNIAALQYQAIAFRYLDNKEEYAKTGSLLKSYDPLNHFVNFEKYYVLESSNEVNEQSKNAALQSFIHLIQNEQPVETFLQMANDYLQVGLVNEAQSLLAICPAHSLVRYWQAYILYVQGKPFEQALMQANAAAPDFVFPFRNIDFTIFEWVVQHTTHWKPKYYLGLLLKDRNRVAEAKKIFNNLGLQPNYAPFYATRASLYGSENNLPIVYAQSITDLQKAISMDPSSWRYIKTLTELYNTHFEYAKALTLVAPFYKTHTDNYIIGMLYAKTLIHNQAFVEADQLLATLHIIPFEGATLGHELYREAKLMQALNQMQQKKYTQALDFVNQAKLWPENLGAGKPYDEDIDIRLEHWISYHCFQQLKQYDSAQSKLNAIIQFMPNIHNTVSNFYAANHLVTIWAYDALGQSAKGRIWFQQQLSKYPENALLKWVQKTKDFPPHFHNLPLISSQLEDATIRILRKM